MGVAPNLLIHYFKTKDAMILELSSSLMSDYRNNVIASMNHENGPENRLKQVLRMGFLSRWNLKNWLRRF